MILKQPETKEPFANVASPCANAGGQKRDWQLAERVRERVRV